MVGVFAVFALMPILDMKEMGIGLAAAEHLGETMEILDRRQTAATLSQTKLSRYQMFVLLG